MLPRAHVTTVYETLERPLVPVLAEMEMGLPRICSTERIGLSSCTIREAGVCCIVA